MIYKTSSISNFPGLDPVSSSSQSQEEKLLNKTKNGSFDKVLSGLLNEKNVPAKKTEHADKKNLLREKENLKLKEVTKEVESIFVNMMFKEMRKSLGKDRLFHGGMAEEFFQDMLYVEYSKVVSANSKLGLAQMLYEQLKAK